MEKLLRISDIHIPKNYLPNPNGLVAEKINKEFASSIGLFKLIDEKKFYAASSIGKYAYPYASLDGLVACCQLVEWLFYIDDQFDENEELAADRDSVVNLIEKYIALFRTGTEGTTSDPITKLSSSLREKLLKLGTEEWFERICISTENYFRIGVLGAVDVWRNNQPYTLETYMPNREHDAGVYTCIDMIEIVSGLNLTIDMINDERVQQLRKLTARHVAFSNDLYSYNKEVAGHANPNNLVYLLMYWQKLSFEEAVSKIVEILNTDMESFLKLKEQLLAKQMM